MGEVRASFLTVMYISERKLERNGTVHEKCGCATGYIYFVSFGLRPARKAQTPNALI